MGRETIMDFRPHTYRSIFLLIVLSVFFIVVGYQSTAHGKIDKNIKYFELDTTGSYVFWKNSNHYGKVFFESGHIITSENTIKDIDLKLSMNTIKVEDIDYELMRETLTNVLKSSEFFNTKYYPYGYFKLHSAEQIDNKKYSVSGDINLMEADICKTFDARVKMTKNLFFMSSDTIYLDRTLWGIFYLSRNNLYPGDDENTFIVSDTISISVNIAGKLSN